MMYLALTYDHRLLDGREAVTFLVKVCLISALVVESLVLNSSRSKSTSKTLAGCFYSIRRNVGPDEPYSCKYCIVLRLSMQKISCQAS